MTNEERFINIEIKVTRQEDLTQELSEMVYQQQKRIDDLQELCAALARRIGGSSGEGAGDPHVNEKPPHY